jgi:hypothetical protein
LVYASLGVANLPGVPSYTSDQTDVSIRYSDDSVVNTTYQRLYIKMEFPFRTDKTYKIKEYIKTVGDLPINTIKYFVAVNQDILDDNETDSYIFVGTSGARKIQVESSWSMVCLVGIGRAGMEHVIMGNDVGDPQSVQSNYINGTVLDVKSTVLIIPLRMTQPMNITLWVFVKSGVSTGTFYYNMDNVMGTIVVGWNWNASTHLDPDPTAINRYSVVLILRNFNTSSAGQYICFSAYDKANSLVGINNNYMDPDIIAETLQSTAMHFEIYEYDSTLFASEKRGIDPVVTGIIGIGEIISSVILGVIAVATGWTPLGLFIGGIAVNMFLNGVAMVAQSAMYGALPGVLQTLADGFGRVIKPLIDGFNFIVGGLFLVAGKILEAVKFIGEAWQHYGSAILEAFVEIVWFVVFLMVMAGWALFLSIMRCILHGDFEGAWRIAKRAIKSDWAMAKKAERFAERQTVGRYKKAVKWKREGIGYRRNQNRQERKTRAYEGSESARGESYREQQEWYKRRNQSNRSRSINNDNAGQGSGRIE